MRLLPLLVLLGGCRWLDESRMLCVSSDNCFEGWRCGDADEDGDRHCTRDEGDDDTPIPGDADEDGWTPATGDCDDDDPAVYPGADEVDGNGQDDNCDGVGDERETLRYDDDGREEWVAPLAGEGGSMVALVFAAATEPLELEALRFHLLPATTDPQPSLRALVLGTSSGEPVEGDVRSALDFVPGDSEGWHVLDLSSSPVQLDESVFAVALQWVEAVPVVGAPLVPVLGADTTAGGSRTWFLYGPGQDWQPYNSGEAMIRADIRR